MKPPKKTVRSVKGFAVIGKNGVLCENVGTDGIFYFTHSSIEEAEEARACAAAHDVWIVVPCTITYQLPNKGKKGGNK